MFIATRTTDFSVPAGDAQRAWFPEMLSELERFWKTRPDWTSVVAFCEEMTSLRSQVRDRRGIRPAKMMCRSCGEKHEMITPPISPRSLLFALRKIDAVDGDEFKRLDKDWMRFRKQNNLNKVGRPSGGDARKTPTCD